MVRNSGFRGWFVLLACMALFVLPAATCDGDRSMSESMEDAADSVDEAGEEIADEVDDAF